MRTLITCHANADCDAFAAMLAARHLYEDASLLFPGTQEAGLGNVYKQLDKQKYGFLDTHDIKWNEFDRLVLVDTRQKSRVPHVAPLLDSPGIAVEIWDHHPASSDDLGCARLHFAETGAVTSLICSVLRQKNIKPDSEEATLLGLGIYGDTGAFTYSSTRQEDFQAASWLLECGMKVERLNNMACHELSSLHVQALNNLLESVETYRFNDIDVAIAEASMEHYLGDFAYLAHQLMEMEKFPALFAIGIMGDRIQVVARSRNNNINVGEICAELGGGGHFYAASASVRTKMANEVRESILRALQQHARPEKTARDYMTSPAIGIESTISIHNADELMLHFGLKAVPVFNPGTRECIGILDGQTAARAAAHGLGNDQASEYMQRRIETLGPEATIRDLAEIIIDKRQRLVPIVHRGQVDGVVTRTDLINVFADESRYLSAGKRSKPHNVSKLIRERLPRETRKILALAGDMGKQLGLPVYAVGGFARDLLIGHDNQDIDLVAEGNGIALARALAEKLNGRVREHQKFLTSVVIFKDAKGMERHIDVATARLEYYEYPAALPTVELSSIKMDLFRRDFSINALAIRLDGEHFGSVEDFFGGRRDIKDRLIRVLHTLSFVEDPTRCIRAVRFEQRYGFRIGPGTEKLIKKILPMHLLEKLSPQRLFNEIRHLSEEENGAACFERLDNLGILKQLAPQLALTQARKILLKRIQELLSWHRLLFFDDRIEAWICYFLALCQGMTYADSSLCYDRLGLPAAKKGEIMRQRVELRNLKPKLLQWQEGSNDNTSHISAFCAMLANISQEALLYAMASFGDPGLEKNISRFITRWRREKADINGHDLERLGLTPGPIYGKLLKLALDAKLDGVAPTAKTQLALIMQHLQKEDAEGQSDLASSTHKM